MNKDHISTVSTVSTKYQQMKTKMTLKSRFTAKIEFG